jgi:hypothetical protein
VLVVLAARARVGRRPAQGMIALRPMGRAASQGVGWEIPLRALTL